MGGIVRPLLVGALMCSMVTVANGQSKVETDWATNELSSEMIECGQYFLVSWGCFKGVPNPAAEATANDYRAASDRISQLALQVGKSIGLTEQAVASRMRLANQGLNKAINGNCVNISILLERYATFCKTLARHPDQRFIELMQCSLKKTTMPCGDH
jgi:hypothetical protein